MNCPHCKQVKVNGATVVDVIDVELENGQEFRIIKIQKERKHDTPKISTRSRPVPTLQKDVSARKRPAVPVLQKATR